MRLVRQCSLLGGLLVSAVAVNQARAVLVYNAGTAPTATRNLLANNSAAGTYSGAAIGDWVAQNGLESAVAIGPHAFLTASHFATAGTFTLGGINYTVTGTATDPGSANSDLKVVTVSQTIPAASIAPLYTTTDEAGPTTSTAVIFGRGEVAGNLVTSSVLVNNVATTVNNGWTMPGDAALDSKLSYGLDTIDFVGAGAGTAQFIGWNFTPTTGSTSLTDGDSGGGVFILKNGKWLLAGINYGVESPYSTSADGSNAFNATISDGRGLFASDNGVYTAQFAPGYSLATRVSTESAWLATYVPEPASLSIFAVGGMLALRRRSR